MMQESAKEYFVVSHTPYETILSECAIRQEDLLALPRNAVVLEVGSGEYQEFAGGAKDALKKADREDIRIISIDPSLGISPDSDDWFLSETGSLLDYHQNYGSFREEDYVDFSHRQLARRENAKKTRGVVAAKAPRIPIASGTVDLVVDNKGAGLYSSVDEFLSYIREIRRILKPEGKASISTLRFIGHPSNETPAEWQKETGDSLRTLLKDELDGLDLEINFHSDDAGIIIKKIK